MKSKLFATATVIGKSIIWSLFTVFFGLLQIWLIWANSFVLKDKEFLFGEFIMDGALLFFSTAIVSSLTIDHYLSERRPYLDIKTILAFILFPFIIVFLSVWLFGVCYGRTVNEVELDFIIIIEYSIFTATLVYAFGIKLMAFNINHKGEHK